MLNLRGSILDWYVASFCFIQTVKSKDVIMLTSGFTLSSLPNYYSGTFRKVGGHVKLLGCFLSVVQSVSFRERVDQPLMQNRLVFWKKVFEYSLW